MNAFYSILSINITPETGEKIAVGLLLSNGKESLFRHSGQKVKILSSLLPQDQISFINKYLKSINKVITEIGKKENELLAFEGLEINHFVNEYYLDYLSNYNQNVITFSKPNRIDVQVEKSVFEKLYKNLITSYLTEKEPQKKHNISLIRDRFIPTVTEYFSIDKELSPNDYDDLKFPVQIDLFGKNEKPVIAKFLDLERNISFVKSVAKLVFDIYDKGVDAGLLYRLQNLLKPF